MPKPYLIEDLAQPGTPVVQVRSSAGQCIIQDDFGTPVSSAYRASATESTQRTYIHHGIEDEAPTTLGADRVLGKARVVAKIEEIFASIANDLLYERSLSIRIQTRAQRASVEARQVSFPGATAEEAWRFSNLERL